MCVCLCYLPTICEVFSNHEVVMLQPQTVTAPKPRICLLLLHSLLLNPLRLLLLTSNVLPGETPTPDLTLYPLTSALSPYWIIHQPRPHLYPFQYTKKTYRPPHMSFLMSDSSPLPSPLSRLPDSCHRRSLDAAKISSNMDLSCFQMPPSGTTDPGAPPSLLNRHL